MEMYFDKMSESYRDKHYPKGSVLEKSSVESKRGAVVLTVMIALLAAMLGVALYFEISMIQYYMGLGDSESIKVGAVILAITGLLFLLCILGIVFCIKSFRNGVETTIRKSAKISGLSENDIREFDRQAMQSDSYILKFKNKVAAAVAGQKDGILTRDYLWMGDAANIIIKREDIVGACFYKWHYYAGKKRVWNQSVVVLNRHNIAPSAEATRESGLALMELLAAAHPDIHVEKKLLDEGKEYDNWRTELCSKAIAHK